MNTSLSRSTIARSAHKRNMSQLFTHCENIVIVIRQTRETVFSVLIGIHFHLKFSDAIRKQFVIRAHGYSAQCIVVTVSDATADATARVKLNIGCVCCNGGSYCQRIGFNSSKNFSIILGSPPRTISIKLDIIFICW